MGKHNDINLVSYYRELLIKPVPEDTTSIGECVLRSWLRGLAKSFEIDSMRLYLYHDRDNNVLIRHVYGDKEIWKDVDITKFRKEKTKFKHLFFVKIRHIRENGQFLVLGYLAFHTENYVTEDLLESLEVLCMLYGNYIVKRLIKGQSCRINKLLPQAYALASPELPGTKILGILECLYGLAGFNYGLYCTVQNKTIVAEYIASNKKCTYLRKHTQWKVAMSFIDDLQANSGEWNSLSEMPQKIIQFILFKDERNPEDFSIQFFPVYVDEELVGLWMFVYSLNNPFITEYTNNILKGTYPLLKDSYRFLFQRRFNSMIVNPIFQNRDTRVNQDSVFVIMPFTQKWSNDIWQQVLKPAVQEIGMTPIRADDLYGQNIMEDVWQSILKAAIIICDTTGRNPNVFYELGIAHTLGKKVLLLTQSIDDIPFDLQAYRHIEYQPTISGANQLKETIKKYINETLSSK